MERQDEADTWVRGGGRSAVQPELQQRPPAQVRVYDQIRLAARTRGARAILITGD